MINASHILEDIQLRCRPKLNLHETLVSQSNYVELDLMRAGNVNVSLAAAANIGDQVYFDTTTGAIGSQSATATFTASQTTTVLTVASSPAVVGTIGVGKQVFSAGVLIGTVISLGTGTGGAGTYNMNTSASVSSAVMTSDSVAPSGKAIISNAMVDINYLSAAGVGIISLNSLKA